MKYYVCIIGFVLLCCNAVSASAEEDPLAEYQHEINKPADANVINVYDAWGNNLAHRIKSGYADGVVIDGEGKYAGGKVRADGLGNVVVDQGANVGPIINQTGINNSNIIIQNNKRF